MQRESNRDQSAGNATDSAINSKYGHVHFLRIHTQNLGCSGILSSRPDSTTQLGFFHVNHQDDGKCQTDRRRKDLGIGQGNGIIKQKSQDFREAIEALSEGLEVFPESIDLNICIGLSYMNLGDYDTALGHFLKFPDSKDALYHVATCYKELGDSRRESVYLEKAHVLEDSLN